MSQIIAIAKQVSFVIAIGFLLVLYNYYHIFRLQPPFRVREHNKLFAPIFPQRHNTSSPRSHSIGDHHYAHSQWFSGHQYGHRKIPELYQNGRRICPKGCNDIGYWNQKMFHWGERAEGSKDVSTSFLFEYHQVVAVSSFCYYFTSFLATPTIYLFMIFNCLAMRLFLYTSLPLWMKYASH